MGRWLLCVVVTSACGRAGFDRLVAGAEDGVRGGDDAVAGGDGVGVGDDERTAWYTSGTGVWEYRKRIAIDGGHIAGALVDFPFLFGGVDPDLRSVADGGRVESANDIVFTDGDGVTLMDFEIEGYDAAFGVLFAWVRIPRLEAGIDHRLFVYFGNAGVTTSQENAAAVWDAGFSGVWHMAENPTGSDWLDSTTWGHDCLPIGNFASTGLALGQIGGGSDWDATTANVGDCHNVGSLANLFAGGGTISVWIRPTGWGRGTYGRIADRSFDDQAVTGGYGLQVNEDWQNPRSLEFDHGFDVNRGSWTTGVDSILLGIWQHIVVVYDDSSVDNDPSIYINGVVATVTEQVVPNGVAIPDDAASFVLGNSNSRNRTFDGIIDEVRVSRLLRSPAWIATSYANQSAQGMASVGPLETR